MPTQTPIETRRPPEPVGPEAPPKIHRVEVYWTTVTYKTVAIYILLAAAVLLGIGYFVAPSFYSSALRKINSAITSGDTETAAVTQTQAKFVNLDGRVQVKKVDSVQWTSADYRMTLDKGDLIQTGGEGVAGG